MALYLLQVTYTPEAWAAQLKSPQDRTKVVAPLLEQLGGRFVNTYFAFGDYDIVAVLELPDNVSAAAASLAISAGGAVKAIKTTPLLAHRGGAAGDAQGCRSGRGVPSADRGRRIRVDTPAPTGRLVRRREALGHTVTAAANHSLVKLRGSIFRAGWTI